MYGEETAERQYSEEKKITQRESDYDKDTETRWKWESSKRRKKKSLVEDNNPMYLEGVRTIGKSDSAVPQMIGQPGQEGSRPRIFTNTQPRSPRSWVCWHYTDSLT